MPHCVISLNDYLTKLASEAPVPGGGSAALLVGATGCSLVAMVARICAGSKKYEAVHDLANRLVAASDDLRVKMLQLRDEDEKAFEAVVAARGDKEAMQRALFDAAAAPHEGTKCALAALELSVDALQLNNANLVSDVGCAGEFAYAALIACAYNVRINHKFMKDQAVVWAQRVTLDERERAAASLLERVRSAVNAFL
jgi:formiminotetrahydrofolate cyclodeaminase